MNKSPIVVYDKDGYYEAIPTTVYPDNMPLVKLPTYPFVVNDIQGIILRPLTLTDFMAGMFFVDAFKERGGKKLDLILPCIPGARQDRLNPVGDYLFTAKSIAKEINMRGFKRVVVIDPHSEVAPALINRCEVIHPYDIKDITTAFKENHYRCVVSPDAGAEKRAGRMARALGIPLVHAWKTRDVKDGSITGFGCEPTIKNFNKILVVDDLCDGGGTFTGLASAINRLQTEVFGENCFLPQLDLYVTHGLFSKGIKALRTYFKNIYTTDSMIQAYTSKATIINVCETL
jgi:ribose-phosphate pyrophosphokinase